MKVNSESANKCERNMRWKKTIDIKVFLNQFYEKEISAVEFSQKTANAIRSEFPALALRFDKAKTVRAIDSLLNELYDAADANKIWMGL